MTEWRVKTYVIAASLAFAFALAAWWLARRGRTDAAAGVGLGLPFLAFVGLAGLIGDYDPEADVAALDLIGVLVPAPLLGGLVGLLIGFHQGRGVRHD